MLTGSKHGYVSVIDRETGENISYTFTRMMGKECQVSGKDRRLIFPLAPNGGYSNLWGHSLNTRGVFYTNDPESNESSGGPPPGHIPIKNFLSVPALVGERLVGQVALANSKEGFSDSDLEEESRQKSEGGTGQKGLMKSFLPFTYPPFSECVKFCQEVEIRFSIF